MNYGSKYAAVGSAPRGGGEEVMSVACIAENTQPVAIVAKKERRSEGGEGRKVEVWIRLLQGGSKVRKMAVGVRGRDIRIAAAEMSGIPRNCFDVCCRGKRLGEDEVPGVDEGVVIAYMVAGLKGGSSGEGQGAERTNAGRDDGQAAHLAALAAASAGMVRESDVVYFEAPFAEVDGDVPPHAGHTSPNAGSSSSSGAGGVGPALTGRGREEGMVSGARGCRVGGAGSAPAPRKH